MAGALILAVALALGFVIQRYDWNGFTEDLAGVGGDAGAVSGDEVNGAEMPRLYERELTGTGAAAVAVTEELTLIAEVVSGQTEITALTATEGEQAWAGSFDMEPTELRMTVVGGLLVVDAQDSTTDDGQDVRAVVSLEDGELRWKSPWDDTRREVAYYGSEVVVEVNDGIYDNAVVGIDLETGDEVWAEAGPDGLWISDERRVQASTYWDDGGESAGTLPPDSTALYDNLVAGSRIVEIDPDTDSGRVREAATGEPEASGTLPIDTEFWTVYEDLAIGKLSDDASPGRDVLAAYSLSGLEQTWELPLDAGDDIEAVKACGPALVCAAIGNSGNGDLSRMIAVDIANGDQAWSFPMDWSTDAGWYSASGGMVFGDKPFDSSRRSGTPASSDSTASRSRSPRSTGGEGRPRRPGRRAPHRGPRRTDRLRRARLGRRLGRADGSPGGRSRTAREHETVRRPARGADQRADRCGLQRLGTEVTPPRGRGAPAAPASAAPVGTGTCHCRPRRLRLMYDLQLSFSSRRGGRRRIQVPRGAAAARAVGPARR
ncbi:hypothetical protein GCM10029992_48280 [Glycomyces albus]